MPKVTTPLRINIQNRDAYNLVFWKHTRDVLDSNKELYYIEGLIYEYETNEILTYTLEDEATMKENFPSSKKNPFKIIPAGNDWPNENEWHRGCSSYTVSISKGKGGFGDMVGASNTMLAMDKSSNCLFHPGKTITGANGCILCGNKPRGGVRSFKETEFYPSKIKTSTESAVVWWRNFYDKVVSAICKGKTVHIYLVGQYSSDNEVAVSTSVEPLESEDVIGEEIGSSGMYISPAN